MTLSQAKQVFQSHYPLGFIRSGKEMSGVVASKWAVSFDGVKVYEYTGTLRGTLERVLGGKMTRQESDTLAGIVGRCKNGCPIMPDDAIIGYCPNCGSQQVKIINPPADAG